MPNKKDEQLCLQLFLERTNPHMLPAAASIFFTLDKRMDGEIRYKVKRIQSLTAAVF